MTKREQEPNKRRTHIEIEIGRATLGMSKYAFVVMKTLDEKKDQPINIPREDIVIDEQTIGERLSARLMVDIIGEEDNYYLVETEDGNGIKIKLKVDKDQHRIIPFRYQPIFRN